MTAWGVAQLLLAVLVLAGIAHRLALLAHPGTCRRKRASWHAWVAAQVAIALGALCAAFDLARLSSGLFLVGLSLYYGVRWSRQAAIRGPIREGEKWNS